MGILTSCVPRKDVLSGDLKDAIFAADFGDVISNHSGTPEVYRDPELFFRNTHPARDLTKVVREVFGALARKSEPGLALRLSTGFGGGKTHTLLTLWHLAGNIGKPSLGVELLPATGRPNQVHVAAVDGAKAGHPVFAQHGGVVVKSLAGEIAYLLGGAANVKKLGAADDISAQPTEAAVEALLPEGPVLILLDELVLYLSGLDDQGRKNTLNVVNKLVAIASRRPQTVLVVTDPGSQPSYAGESADLGKVLLAARALDELLGRKTTDFDPIGSESAKVIARRLFESVDPKAAQACADEYHSLYKRISEEHPGTLPSHSRTAEYAKRIADSYPFHPRLLDTAKDRLGALADFQRSRGVLRLFARIIRDVWERREDTELITAAEIDFSSSRIKSDLLQRLNKDQFEAAVSADVIGHAGELDNGKRSVHTRVASALMLESLAGTSHSGLTPDDLTLAVVRPDEAGQEPIEALDHLIGTCWHIYPMDGGAGYQFRVEPNVRKQIEERRNRILVADAEARVQTEAQQYFQGGGFKVRNWPEHANAAPDASYFQLVLCDSEQRAKSVVAYADDRDPAAPVKRRFINAVVALAPTEAAYRASVQRAQSLMAAEELEREYRTGDSGAMIREQLKRIKPDLEKQFRVQARRSFDRVIVADGGAYSIDETFQGGEDEILKAPQGQQIVRKFLEQKQLIYGGLDGLAPKLLLQKYLKGAVPVSGETEVWTAAAIHERLLSAAGLRLVADDELTRRTLLKALVEGLLVAKLPSGEAYDHEGAVEGATGARRRVPGKRLAGLPISEDILIALPSAAPVTGWLAVDSDAERPKDPKNPLPPQPPPPPQQPLLTTDLSKAVEAAKAGRPLRKLTITAHSPTDAKLLSQFVQPFGPTSITLSVSVDGEVKGGGTMGLNIEGVKHTHPMKPFDVAGAIANSLTNADSFTASLALDFNPALLWAADHLQKLSEVGSDLTVACEFGASTGGEA